ncbi:MAG TPA: glycosyltransferase family 2 protein [Planctomycetales bacterium]|jgi:GT2 family glycosyltransferase|nr:glycosyltransferase family 2 protein [Planctomycetales bacterium]
MLSRPAESQRKHDDEAPHRRGAARSVVSVCIVNWNCRKLLKACLRSLTSQLQGLRLEVIVVDNASTDGAADMVARVFPRVVLVRNADNAGFARANNQAARLARGRYFFFLNNDTVVPPGTLRRLVEYARAHPEIGLLGPRMRDRRGRTQVSCRRRPTVAALLHRTCLLRWTGLFRAAYRRYRSRDAAVDQVRPVEVLMGAALLTRRSLFRESGGWGEEFPFGGEDIDLCTRIGRGRAVVYHPGIEILHYGRASSRQRIDVVYAQTIIGVARAMRKAGASSTALGMYKLVVTLDEPLHWLRQFGQYLWRRARRRRAAAERSLMVLHGIGGFVMRGLPEFWRV